MVAQVIPIEEALLISRARDGDQDAFRQLVERYQGALNSGLPDAGRPRRCGRCGARNLRAHLSPTGALRPCTEVLDLGAGNRDQLLHRPVAASSDAVGAIQKCHPLRPHAEAGPEGEAITQEERDEVQRLITQLPEKYRAPLVLRYFEELSCAEIAEVLGMPEGTVKTQIHRARKALGKLLAEGEEPQDALSRV